MTCRGTTTPIVAQREDTRTDGPMAGGERAVLDHWLDLYRDTALLKIAGLDAEQLTRRAVPPSSMSLIGVVRHLTEVEAYWLRVVLLDEQDVPGHYCTPARPDGDFDDVDPATAAADVEAYQAELATTSANAKAWTDPWPYPSAGCARASNSTYGGSSPISSRSMPATSATWTFSARRSTAVPATDHISSPRAARVSARHRKER
jgi:hypothetical protein